MTEKRDGLFVTMLKKAVGLPTAKSGCCGPVPATETKAKQESCCTAGTDKSTGNCCG